MNIIEKAAVWYLSRKGRVVLPRIWIGMALGFGAAFSHEPVEQDKPSVWTVSLPPGGRLYALNHSMIDGTGRAATYTAERAL